MAHSQDARHVVVCGAGVIGCCVAYYLAQQPGVRVTVVERTGVACASSGKAGGFLAADWSDGSPLGPLSRASFRLHARLAEDLDGPSAYGYRRVHTLSVGVEEDGRRGSGPRDAPAWIDGPVKSVRAIGSPGTTAQVHPELFTKRVLSAAVERFGVRVVAGDAQEVRTEAARVMGVVVSGELVAADAVVVAMGPWSAQNALVASLTAISGLKAHSIVLRPKGEGEITPHAVFLSYRTRDGRAMDPEVYPRASGEVYVCGMSEQVDLPADAGGVEPREEATAMLQRVAATVSTRLGGGAAELSQAQACFLPCSEDGLPVIGGIPGMDGAFVATGHSCWGILNAPATGASLAELIAGGASKTVDLKAFDPARFRVSSFIRKFAGR